jgi:hypothetical protein
MAVHVVPSASWRLWTTLAHYPNLVRKLLMRPRRVPGLAATEFKRALIPLADVPLSSGARKSPNRLPFSSRARLLLTVRPLGPSSDVFEEWTSFRKRRWRAAFVAGGYREVMAHRGPLFYTGHLMMPGMPFGLRSVLGVVLGPASFAWTMRR